MSAYNYKFDVSSRGENLYVSLSIKIGDMLNVSFNYDIPETLSYADGKILVLQQLKNHIDMLSKDIEENKLPQSE